VIDIRKPKLAEKGSIPGMVNIPAYKFDSSRNNYKSVQEILEKQFDARYRNETWDFSRART
jgi:phage pi2 protein 07